MTHSRKPSRKSSVGRKGRPKPLKLVRVEPAKALGIALVFETGGQEHDWILEQTSVAELMALLLRGRMRSGRRVELDNVELTIEPPKELADDPLLCVAMGPLELCAPVDGATAKAMKTDLDRAMKRPH